MRRRRLLAAAGGGAALAAAGGLAAGIAFTRGNGGPAAPPAAASPSATPATPAAIPASPTATPTQVRSGGELRLLSPRSFSFDTFDAARSGDVSTLEVLGRTHSRLVTWASFETQRIGPDLASAWEQPEPGVAIFALRPTTRWHDRAPLNGRPVTAEDVVASLRRSIVLAGQVRLPALQRAADLLTVIDVTTPGAGLVRIQTNPANVFILETLAARFALVQAPEAVEAFSASWDRAVAASVIGSGPFLYDGQRSDGSLTFTSAPAGHARSQVDTLLVRPPGDPVGAFVAGRTDIARVRDRRDLAALAAVAVPGIVETRLLEEEPVVSSMFVGAPPWNNPALGRAISFALNRGLLGEALFAGRALAATAVSPATGPLLREATLRGLSGFGEPAADAREARALWDAAGGPALGTVTIDFPSIFDPLYSASSVVTELLNEVLGQQFHAAVETYTTISRKTLEHAYGSGKPAFWFGWGPAYLEPDPSRWLNETYGSGSPGARSTGIASAGLDALLRGLVREPEIGRRQALLPGIARELDAQGGAGLIHWLVQRSESFSRSYVRGHAASSWWTQHLDAAVSLDTASAAYISRP